MRAVRIHSFGGPDVLALEEAPGPQAGEGEVLVRVEAAGVNPVDAKTREGRGAAGSIGDFPVILGWDVSGVVEEVGPGAEGFDAGDAVFGMVRFPEEGAAYAEYVAAPASQLAGKPDSLDHVQAAGVPLVSLTAWQALFEAADLAPGQTILVHAAAGGVGHIAVQLARWKGARVIGTASGRNREFLEGLGVDEVVDYTAEPFESLADLDVVLDAVGGEVQDRSLGVLRRGGTLVSIVGAPSEETAERLGVRGVRIRVRPDADQLAEIARLIDQGAIRPNVGEVLPLTEARRAQELSESGHTRGKIVLRIGDP